MLVDEVALEGGDDPLAPPLLLAHLRDPLDRRVPVVVDVVVVEDHRAGDRREQPADHRLAPGRAVQAARSRRRSRPRRRRPGAARCAGGPRPRRPGRRAAAARAAIPPASGASSAGPGRAARRPRARCRRFSLGSVYGGSCGAATRQEPNTIVTGSVERVRAQDARREVGIRLRPHHLAVERDLVRRRGVRRQAVDVHDRVVVALDAERGLAVRACPRRGPRPCTGRRSGPRSSPRPWTRAAAAARVEACHAAAARS